MDAKSTPGQEEKWARRYMEIVKQANITFQVPTEMSDNSSLAQPPAYRDVPTVFSTSAGDEPIVAD